MRHFILLLACAVSTPALAQAQTTSDDVIVMRRQIAKPNLNLQAPAPTPTPAPTSTPTPTPVPADWTYGEWSADATDICGEETITRTATCVTAQGPVSSDQCDPARRESIQETISSTAGCTAVWDSAAWTEWSNSCSPQATRTREVTCVALEDAAIELDPASCAGAEPHASENGLVVSGCAAVDWHIGEWTEWTANCGNAQHTRTVRCEAVPVSGAVFTVDDGLCAKQKPIMQETALRANCANTVENPGFETGSKEPWAGSGTSQLTMDGTTNWGTDGNYTGKLLQGQTLSNYIKDLVPNGKYRVTYMMRPTATQASSTLEVTAGNRTQQYARTSADVSWQQHSIDFVAFAGGATPITFTAKQGIFYFDKVIIVPLP